MVEQTLGKYQTLYSGGNHWHRLDNVGGTLDLYRLWKGYPDVKLRSSFRAPEWRDPDFGDNPYDLYNVTTEQLWANASWPLHSGGPAEPDRKQAFWAGWGLDTMTSVGPAPDWWRRPQDFDNLGERQKWVAEKARTDAGLDWLQMAIAASNAPWANSWRGLDDADQETREAYHRLAEASLARFRRNEGLEWLVVAALNEPQIGRTGRLAAELGKLREEVKSCAATPGGYAAYAVVRSVVERDIPEPLAGNPQPGPLYADMPVAVRYATVTSSLESYALNRLANGVKPDRLHLYRAADIPGFGPAVDIAELYAASRIEDVPLSGDGYVLRAYNLLSTEHLASLARRSGADPSLVRVVFARNVALGRIDKAKALLPDLKAASSKDAATIDRIWNRPWAEPIRLALIVLELPDISTMVKADYAYGDFSLALWSAYTQDRRNVPPDYASGEYLQRDFETWLKLPQRFGEYRNLHGYAISWMERAKERDPEIWQEVVHVPSVLPDGSSSRGFPFARLIAWDEVRRLSGEDRLTHFVAQQVLGWADQQSRVPAMREEVAATLAKLITLCKFNSCGEMKGGSAGRRAFQIMKSRLAKTKAGKRQRWWHADPGY